MGFKRDYLISEEMNEFMLIGTLLDTAEKIRKSWPDRNMLDKEQSKNIKYAETYLRKFWEGILENLNGKELKKILKRSKDFNVRIMDKFTLERFEKDIIQNSRTMYLPTNEFYKWTEEVMHMACRGCDRSCMKCDLHTVFDNNQVPESDWKRPNCKYSYGGMTDDNTSVEKK